MIKQSTTLAIKTPTPTTSCQCLDGSNISCTSNCPVGFTPMRNYVRIEATYSYVGLFGSMSGLLPASPLDAVIYVRTQ